MKKIILRPATLLFALVGWLAAGSDALAQIYAQDDASSYSNAPANAAWLSGANTNGGFGFTPWTFATSGGGFQGFFIGGGPIATGGKSWGMYANSGVDAAAVAYRGFTNALETNQVFKIKWQAVGIGFDPSDRGGFILRNGNASATTTDLNTGSRFEFYYIGGGVDSFLILDGSGVTTTGLGFGANPLLIEFTLLTENTYRLIIKNASGSTTLATFDNMALAGSGPIESAALFAQATDGDQIFNSLQISSTSLLPPEIVNLNPSNGVIYASAAAPFSFDVASLFSTVSSGDITLTLNGTSQTNLSFTGSGTSNVNVVLNTPLQDNLVYTGTITAQDANGNRATNNFTFNTWRADNPFIEAEDYNFSSGNYIDNFLAPQPNQAYAGLFGVNGVDYLEYDLTGANNAYRPGDLPQVEAATDVDHANFALNGFQDYNLAFIQNGEFENYTRRMSNTTYAVYARMAGFGNNATMLMDRLATATATSSNQPRASLGTFVCPNTGGPQNWTFVPLKDFFSNPVLVNFPGTNTFRLTCIGSDGNYNLTYLILVPQTGGATLRPYLASGFPFPGAGNVGPDQNLSFVIANRQTAVTPGSIQVFLNSNNITGGAVLSNNAAGTTINYQSPTLLPAGTNTLLVSYSDGSVLLTNQWQFTVVNLPVIPAGFALPLSLTNGIGFSIQIAKAADSSTNTDFPATIARALAQLAGTLTNSQTGQPYTNLAAGPGGDGSYLELNAINYDITGTPQGSYTFNFKTNFPYVPASGTNNFIAMAANMYLYLPAGVYTFAVRSDDGFQLTTGPTPTSTNLTLGIFDGGRGNDTPTQFDFIVETNGLYPMRLIYDQGEFGGNIEFYSVDRANGTPALINDPMNPNSIRAYLIATAAPVLSIARSGGNVVLTWSDSSFGLQAAPSVTGTYTNVNGATSPYLTPIGGAPRFFRLAK